MKSHNLQWKKNDSAEMKKLASKYKVVAIADLSMFPANLFQKVRKSLGSDAVVKVSKASVIRRALQEANVDASKLVDHVNGSVGIIFTDLDPFMLSSVLRKNRGALAAKPGMTAEFDIVVPEGDTGLPPGPALTDLKAAGLNVQLKGPSIKLVGSTVIAKKGSVISEPVANALSKLNIRPFKAGLRILSASADHQLFDGSVLDIDPDETNARFQKGFMHALNLSVFTGYFNSKSTPLLIAKAVRAAKAIDALTQKPVELAPVESKPVEEKQETNA